MATLNLKQTIVRAVDHKDARAASSLVDALRQNGYRYSQILALVQKERPNVTAADWDELLYEADDLESGD